MPVSRTDSYIIFIINSYNYRTPIKSNISIQNDIGILNNDMLDIIHITIFNGQKVKNKNAKTLYIVNIILPKNR